jgi:hypothetical protein
MQEVKRDSSQWINQNKFVIGKFSWQEGYGAFSYSKSQISRVADYIENQEKHHAKTTFTEEYRKILDNFGVEYDNRYIFHGIEQDASLRDAVSDVANILPSGASLRDADTNVINHSTERSIPTGCNCINSNIITS